MLEKIRVFAEMIKFSHTIFALPFALLAACLASVREGGWRLVDFIGILLCMVFARSAAMGFNRFADRELDARNPRTQTRAIPAGQLTAGQVLAFTIACSFAFIASTTIFWFRADNPNPWPVILSVPVLLFVLGYSYAKRFTELAHVWLGVALALSPVAAWIAIRATLGLPPVLLALAVAFWVTGFDIIYACQDIEVDREQRLHSIPARFGYHGAMWIARLAHLLMLVSLACFGLWTAELNLFFWLGYACVVILLITEHWLVRVRDLGRINLAFFQVNGIISAGLLAVTLIDLYLRP